MIFNVVETTQFRRDIRKVKKRGKSLDKLKPIITTLLQRQADPRFPLANVFAENYNSLPLNAPLPKDNPLAGPFKVSEYSDFSGTAMGEYYHMMQFLQESLAEITKVKVPFSGFNGMLIPQEFARPALTGNVPVFDPVAEGYGWMDSSPYYQEYVDRHIRDEHGGIHDVFSPRGYHPNQLFAGGGILTGQNLTFGPTPNYQSPDFVKPSFSAPY